MGSGMIKPKIQVLLCSILGIFHASTSLAMQPVSGPYAGIFLGPTYTPNISFNFNPGAISPNTINSFKSSVATYFGMSVEQLNSLLNGLALPNQNIPGTLKLSVLGGIGGDIGYRIHSDYRLEAEILFNNNPVSDLIIGEHTIGESESGPTVNIDGDLNTAALMFNFIYDIPIQSKNQDGYAAVRPYLGAGVGYAYVFNSLTFNYGENTAEQADGAEPTTLYESTLKRSRSELAVQAIVGVSYFMDDFCWLSLDARYLTTPIKYSMNSPSPINFQTNTTLYSVMLGFHGRIGRGA